MHCHGYTGEDWEGLPKTAVGMEAPRLCRAWRVQVPKDEARDHSELAVKYWTNGYEPVKNHIDEKRERMAIGLKEERT